MSNLTLPPNAIAALNANAPYAKARRAAYLKLAQRIVSNPENYSAEDLADAQQVLNPTMEL